MKKIYIAGKLNDNASGYIKNVHKMIKFAEQIRIQGFSVYVPAIDLLMGLVIGSYDYDDYFNNSQPWLEVSDAMFLTPGWSKSKGTLREIQRAHKFNIPTFMKISDLVEWRDKNEE